MKIAIRLAWLLFFLLSLIAGIFYFDPLWVSDQLTAFHLWRQGVHGGYVIADGHRIHYLEARPPDGSRGTPLVLIHGLADRAESWSPQIASLAAAGYHVYVPDLLGYGRSDKPDITCSIPVETAAVAGVLHALGIRHADVAGWSMGGWIAAELALEQPKLVDRLVLEDSAGMRFKTTFSRDLFTPADEAGLHRLMAMLSPHPRSLAPFVARAALRRLQQNARVIQGSMDSMESGSDLLDHRLGAIEQPTLIIWGDQDQLLPISTGLEMHREIPQSVFAVATGCGHLAPSECARPVVQATIEFLNSNPPMRGGELTLRGAESSAPRQIPQSSAP